VADRQFARASKRLAASVKRRRIELGMTQEDAAHAMDMAVRHYQKLEGGVLNVTLRTLIRVASALHLDLKDLF